MRNRSCEATDSSSATRINGLLHPQHDHGTTQIQILMVSPGHVCGTNRIGTNYRVTVAINFLMCLKPLQNKDRFFQIHAKPQRGQSGIIIYCSRL